MVTAHPTEASRRSVLATLADFALRQVLPDLFGDLQAELGTATSIPCTRRRSS